MGVIDWLQSKNNSFFDGLKRNAIKSALKKAKKRKEEPIPLVEKMKEIDKLSDELDELLKKYE